MNCSRLSIQFFNIVTSHFLSFVFLSLTVNFKLSFRGSGISLMAIMEAGGFHAVKDVPPVFKPFYATASKYSL